MGDHLGSPLADHFFSSPCSFAVRENSSVIHAATARSQSPSTRAPKEMERGQKWRVGASIPLPTACEAVALPFELTPQNRYTAAPRVPVGWLRPAALWGRSPPPAHTTTATGAPRPACRGRFHAGICTSVRRTQVGAAQGNAISACRPRAPQKGANMIAPSPAAPHALTCLRCPGCNLRLGGRKKPAQRGNRTFWKQFQTCPTRFTPIRRSRRQHPVSVRVR